MRGRTAHGDLHTTKDIDRLTTTTEMRIRSTQTNPRPLATAFRPNQAASRRRSLVRDVCRCLSQQMVFWGMDAGVPGGNLLLVSGLERIARSEVGGEGSSRYRARWQGGVIELHSFCAGWYPADGEGVLFVRNRERLHSCPRGRAITPGDYRSAIGAAPDEILPLVRPLVEWVLEYERAVRATTAPGYRELGWSQVVAQMGVRPWLAPDKAIHWMEQFVADPNSAPRARELARRARRPSGANRNFNPRIA